MTDAIEFYPNTMSEEQREAHLLELYPIYRPDRPDDRVTVQQIAEPEPQQESPPVIEVSEIAAPPVETDEPIAQEPKRVPALKNVYIGASSSLAGK